MANAISASVATYAGARDYRQPTLRNLQGVLAAALLSALSNVALLLPSSALADEQTSSAQTPAQLIESMSLSLRTLNYEGTFVHAQGANLTTMQILHASNRGGEFERLVSLDGEAREVIRNNSLVTCIWPGSESVIVSKSKPRDLLPRIDASLATSERYKSSLGAPDRVAGRVTHVVNVIPMDEYRYGYRFWIDADNGMLLRSMLLEGAQNVVEQMMFTNISYPDSIDISRFDVLNFGERGDTVSWLEPKKAQSASTLDAYPIEHADKVSFDTLPGGYQKISETYATSMPMRDGPVSHVMLSDGMASVSVYVEHLGGEVPGRASVGLSRMGAMNAFGLQSDTMLITAVGEVPEATVKAIATSVIVNE